MSIRKLFEPNSVAVVGASKDPDELGHKILKNLVEADFEGKIYPVDSGADEILGLKCYASLEEAPKKTQLAVIVKPPEEVPSVLEECSDNNVGNAVLISGGFSEMGRGGEELEKEVLKVADEMDIRILGPNCRGINNTSNGLCASWPLITRRGPISVVTQSGTIGAALENWAQQENIGISKFAALGNKADIDEADLIDYLAEDEETGAIAIYMEVVEKGREFLKAARKAAELKPVIVLKGGRSELGIEAVGFHTQSLPGDHRIFKSACKQAGLIQAQSIREFYDLCKGVAVLPKPKEKNTVIITSSGGAGVLATDVAEDLDLALIDLPQKSIEFLEEALPSRCILRNPLDLTGSATAEMYDEAIKILARYKDIRNLVVIVGHPMSGIAEVIGERFDRLTMVPVMLGLGDEGREEEEKLKEAGIPFFSDPEMAMKVLDAL